MYHVVQGGRLKLEVSGIRNKIKMTEIEEDFKYNWHVKWREHNPVSWFLCWLFERNIRYMPMFFFYVHDWFCPEVREVKEMAKAESRKKKSKPLYTIPLL